MIVDYKFDIKQEVYIPQLNLHGRVKSLSYSPLGAEYYVRYINGGEIYESYFYEDELIDLAAAPKKT